MFTPDDLTIRKLLPRDQKELYNMISCIQREEQQAELKKQIKTMFLHPAMWIVSAVLICVIGIATDSPPIPTSIVIMLIVFYLSKKRFQEYWSECKVVFNSRSEDLREPFKFYAMSREKRVMLVAIHRERIVGSAAIREAPGMPEIAKTAKLWRVFTHPATRRMGIASKLISEALEKARELGYERVALRTHQTNSKAVKLYEKNGFKLVDKETMSAYYPLKFTAMCYELSLLGAKKEEQVEKQQDDEK